MYSLRKLHHSEKRNERRSVTLKPLPIMEESQSGTNWISSSLTIVIVCGNVVMTTLITKSYQNKPTLLISSLDLVSIDIARSYSFLCLASCFCYILFFLNIKVSDESLALAMSWTVEFAFHFFMILINSGIILSYFHVHQGVASIEGWLDMDIVRLLRLVSLVCSFLVSLTLIIAGGKPQPFGYLTRVFEEDLAYTIVTSVLFIVTILINVTLRTLIWKRRVEPEEEGYSGQVQVAKAMVFGGLFSTTALGFLVFYFVILENGIDPGLVQLLFLVLSMLVVPGWFIYKHKWHYQYCRKIFQCFWLSMFSLKSNQVSPA